MARAFECARRTSRARQGSATATLIARAFSTVAWILAPLRMIEGSWSSRSTSCSVMEATLRDVEVVEGSPESVALTEHDRPTEPGLKHAQGKRLEQRRLVVGARTPDLIVVAATRGIAASSPGTARPAVVTDDHVVAHPALQLLVLRAVSTLGVRCELRPGGLGKISAGVRVAGDSPAAVGRFGEQHPRALRQGRVGAGGCDDLR